MRRLVYFVPWALGLVLLLTPATAADNTIEALRRAEREAIVKLAKAYRNLWELAIEERWMTREEPVMAKLEQEARQAESNAQQAAEARRAVEARNINTTKGATEARERFERAADSAKRAADERYPFGELFERAARDELQKFYAAEARKDFKAALEREAELLDEEADRLEAEATKPGASDQIKAEATRARGAADIAAGRLQAEFPPPQPPDEAKPPPAETGPSGSAPPPNDPLQPGFDEVITQRGIIAPPSFASAVSMGAGGQPVSAEMTVVVENRQGTIVCLPKGKTVPGLDGEVIAEGPAEVLVVTSKSPEEAERLARASGVTLCFVEINFCVIKTPLTAFRGHVHKVHPGGIHNHDAPDPPWNWSVTPPEAVVVWGGE